MRKWIKTSLTIMGNGEKTIKYRANGIKAWIESRKKAIEHSNRSGVWFHTTYFVCYEGGIEKEYWTLKDAQEAAEEENEN